MPFFTVVIALYNKENFVAGTLSSVLSQTFTDFEVIGVNDVSTDSTVQIVNAIDDNRIRIVNHDTNKGLNAARNTGIRHASADVVTFIDADDLWKPDFLQTIYDLIQEFPQAGIFATNYLEAFPGPRLVEPMQHLEIEKGASGIIADYFTSALAQPILWYGSVAIRRDVFDRAGFFDESITLWEDVDFNIRAAMVAEIAFVNSPKAVYNVYTENQIINSPVVGKRIPDFSKYENLGQNGASLKRYLDVNRQILAVKFKASGDIATYSKLQREIDARSLTFRQKIMLALPPIAIRLVKRIKVGLLKSGFRLTSFK